jgi:hypothetical protein
MDMDDSLVAVALGNGLVVWHTREEWDAFMRGVDREAVEGMQADLDDRADA